MDSTLYAIFLKKVEGRELPKEVILRHVEHLGDLDNAGHLILCGPFTDAPSGMVIVRAKDKAEATALAKQDPFVQEGFRTFEVWTWLMANSANGYLA